MKNYWEGFSLREKRLILITLVILLVVVGKQFVVDPLMERRVWVRSQLDRQPQLLEKNLRYLSQKDAMAKSLESARAQIKAREPKFLIGDTASVSASDLQETVQTMAAREGTQVITTRVLNPEPSGSFSKIAIQMEIGGEIEQIIGLLRSIDNAPKLLVVDEINVRSLFRPLGFPRAARVAQATTQNLRVSLTVAGFARAQASPSTKAN